MIIVLRKRLVYFHPSVEETKCLIMENTRKYYNLVYVICGVLDGVLADKRY